VEPGKIAAIVGPSGIGKTSLLRAMLGLDRPRTGTIAWGAEDLTTRGVGPFERPFAWVPQDAPVLGDTLVANVTLGVTTKAEDPPDALRVLDELGAHGLAEALGGSVLATERGVSGGERQWIAVARAFATGLPVLLLDEPTSSLDPAAQERMLRAIAGLRGKRTVVIVTHRSEPLAIADVVVRLGSEREDAQDRAGLDLDTFGMEQLSVEDVAVAARKTQTEAAREHIDTLGVDERTPREHEGHLRA
jgi:ABC-type transport system involved in cytochrome bd biosynthesis fused ATPase/permease subunit